MTLLAAVFGSVYGCPLCRCKDFTSWSMKDDRRLINLWNLKKAKLVSTLCHAKQTIGFDTIY